MKVVIHAVGATLLLAAIGAPAMANDVPELRVGWTVPAEEAKYLLMKRPELFPNLGKTYQIKWTQFQGTSPMVQAMRADVLDCATMAPLSLAQGFLESGLKPYIVAQHVHHQPGNFAVYWAVKDDSPIKSVADLKGKVVGTNAYGSGVYFNMILMLRKHGIDPDKDVKIVETGFPASGDAIRSGRVDAGPLAQPFALLAEEKGGMRKLFALTEVQENQVQIFEGCNQAYADKNAEVVRAYVSDLRNAMKKIQEDPKLAIAVTSEVTRAPSELLGKYLMTDKDFARVPDMVPNVESIQQTFDLYHQAGFLNKPIKVSDFVRKDLYEKP